MNDVRIVDAIYGMILSTSSKVGRNPNILVWTSSAECSKGGAVLQKKKAIIAKLTGHERKVSVSLTGWKCCVGWYRQYSDNTWKWHCHVDTVTALLVKGEISDGPAE